MSESISNKKIQTDEDVKRKAVKLVISHLKKKAADDFVGSDYVNQWVIRMEEILKKSEFNLKEYIEMRKELNGIIERILDEETRYKLRDSWYSLGKALSKKSARN